MAYPQPVADPTAVMGRRIGAILIDLILMSTVVAIIAVPAFLSGATTREFPSAAAAQAHCDTINDRLTDRIDETPSSEFSFEAGDRFCGVADTTTYELGPDEFEQFTLALYGSVFLTVAINWVLIQGLTGASIGKLMVGLRVVRDDGQKAGFGWNLLRTALLVVDLWCCFLIGLITALASKGHRRVGDMAASTSVVAKRSVGTPPRPEPTSDYRGYAGYGGPGPVTPDWGTTAGPDPSTWGGAPPATPTGWAPPTSSGPAATPSADGPTWDAARNAYIQYDRDRGEWIQWNDQAQAWGPIDQ